MRINELLEAVRAELAGLFPDLKACQVHDGKFNQAELKRIATKTPALLVALLGVTKVTDPGTEQSDAELQLAAFVVTRSSPGLDRGPAARALMEALLIHVPRTRWGLTGVSSGRDVRAQNFYAGEIDRQGVALWAVSWRQPVRLGDSIFDDDGTLPSRLYVAFEGEDYEELTNG